MRVMLLACVLLALTPAAASAQTTYVGRWQPRLFVRTHAVLLGGAVIRVKVGFWGWLGGLGSRG